MLTVPSTLGLFEPNILKISEMVHKAGGLMYGDGANLNALVGHIRPGDLGFDVMHINLHKTFTTPHGGGGPGSGPVAARRTWPRSCPARWSCKEGDGLHLRACPRRALAASRTSGATSECTFAPTPTSSTWAWGPAAGQRGRDHQRQLHPRQPARTPTGCPTTASACTRWCSPARTSSRRRASRRWTSPSG